MDLLSISDRKAKPDRSFIITTQTQSFKIYILDRPTYTYMGNNK